MARQINRLSARTVSTVKKAGRHPDGGGLYLSISPNGGRRWVFIFKRGGKSREMGLGAAKTVSLAQARDLAGEVRAFLAKGLDPIAERAARTRGATSHRLSFRDCAVRYIKDNQAGWKNTIHTSQWTTTLEKYVYPTIGSLAVADIGVGDVITILEPIWATKTETASRVRGRIETVLDWAKARGYREAENPARWRGHLDKLLPPRTKVSRVRHHPALAYAEIGLFLTELRQQSCVSAQALEFTILTAARTRETTGASIEEFDLAAKQWTVSGERMKAGKDHRVPLSPRAVEIVKTAMAFHGAKARPTNWLFHGIRKDKHLGSGAMLSLLDRMGHGNVTVHGFRSTFRDWAAECTNFPNQVVEMALAHAIEDKSEAAYRRGDLFKKRAALMTAWSNYCESPRGSVVVMSRAPERDEISRDIDHLPVAARTP
jgi:integrase